LFSDKERTCRRSDLKPNAVRDLWRALNILLECGLSRNRYWRAQIADRIEDVLEE
jgi:hypothetical protein